MIKRTIYFGNPAIVNLRNGQMIIHLPAVEKNINLPENFREESSTSIPIEDIGTVIFDNQQITITLALLSALQENNTAVIICGSTHHPNGMIMPLDVHNVQQERFKFQIEASLPLKKQLWQQTVKSKILNQAKLLENNGKDASYLFKIANEVKSGDSGNHEARAALFYWSNIFPFEIFFSRKRDGDPPNNLLNYGYAILRAITARCLVGSGLLPTLGIHHSNKYNAFCLADDIMEPYRPFVDQIVLNIVDSRENFNELSIAFKKKLLEIPYKTVKIGGEKSVLDVAMHKTTSSLVNCFSGEQKRILYPEFL